MAKRETGLRLQVKSSSRGSDLDVVKMCRVKYASEVFSSLYLWFNSMNIIVMMALSC